MTIIFNKKLESWKHYRSNYTYTYPLTFYSSKHFCCSIVDHTLLLRASEKTLNVEETSQHVAEYWSHDELYLSLQHSNTRTWAGLSLRSRAVCARSNRPPSLWNSFKNTSLKIDEYCPKIDSFRHLLCEAVAAKLNIAQTSFRRCRVHSGRPIMWRRNEVQSSFRWRATCVRILVCPLNDYLL